MAGGDGAAGTASGVAGSASAAGGAAAAATAAGGNNNGGGGKNYGKKFMLKCDELDIPMQSNNTKARLEALLEAAGEIMEVKYEKERKLTLIFLVFQMRLLRHCTGCARTVVPVIRSKCSGGGEGTKCGSTQEVQVNN